MYPPSHALRMIMIILGEAVSDAAELENHVGKCYDQGVGGALLCVSVGKPSRLP